MRRALSRFAATSLCALLLLAAALPLGVPARAEDTAPTVGGDRVTDWPGLQAWLGTHTEGTVYLDATVSLTSSFQLRYPVTIDTGEHGLVFDGGFLSPAGAGAGAQITGEGVLRPVVTVNNMGRLWVGSWANYLYMLNITATGNGEKGGTALYIAAPGTGTLDGVQLNFNQPGQIRACGPEAVGLELAAGFEAYCFDIAVEGPASTAVKAHAGATLCFSSLSAAGEGAQAVAGEGDILVDSCRLSSAPQQANIKVCQGELMAGYYPVRQGSDPEDLKRSLGWNLSFGLGLRGNGPATHSLSAFPVWDSEQVAAIDLSTPGRTRVTGTLFAPWMAAVLSQTPELLVEVRDPDVPTITEVYATLTMVGEERLTYYDFYLWETAAWTTEDCALQISRDGGRTWQDHTGDESVRWGEYSVSVAASAMTEGVLFRVDVPGHGSSNRVRLSYVEGLVLNGSGGDRAGTDRLGMDLDAEEEEDEETPPGSVDDSGVLKPKPGAPVVLPEAPVAAGEGGLGIAQQGLGATQQGAGALPAAEADSARQKASRPAEEAGKETERTAQAPAAQTPTAQAPAGEADAQPTPQPDLARPGIGAGAVLGIIAGVAAGALLGFILLRRRAAWR